MTPDDLRLSAWPVIGPAGMTVTRPWRLVGDDPITTIAVWLGGTLTDVDDLDGAIEHPGTVATDGMSGTLAIPVPSPPGQSTPIRLVIDGAVVAADHLHPSARGTTARTDEIVIRTAERSELILHLPAVVTDPTVNDRITHIEAHALTIGDT